MQAKRTEDWLPPARVERMWRAIAAHEREAPVRRWRRATVVVSSLAVAACIALLFYRAHERHAPPTLARAPERGDVVVTAEKGTSLTLPDGSRLGLAASTELHVLDAGPTGVRLEVDRGVLDCDVVPQAGRRFVVEAPGVKVEVKGTHFTVEVSGVDADTVTVRVDHGRVEVKAPSSGDILATLGAGQTWSQHRGASEVPHVEPATSSASETEPASPMAAPSARVAVPVEDARSLFERANSERIAGRAADAAADYERMRARYPGDPRAGLAAFEAARIRLETLNDPRRALDDLAFASANDRGGFAGEDAEALRVNALDRLGESSACAMARDAFLRAHPGSAHTREVKSACADP
jgi:hypothetical protein